MKWYEKLLELAAKELLVVEKVDDLTKKTRLDICKTCPNYDPGKAKCLICGCFLEAKAGMKVHINPKTLKEEITHCPEGKWFDKEIAEHYRNNTKNEN